MKNPFREYRRVPIREKELPFRRMIRDHETLVQRLTKGFRDVLSGPGQELAWSIEQACRFSKYKSFLKSMDLPRLVKRTLAHADQVYDNALSLAGKSEYTPNDIMNVCALLCLAKEFSEKDLRLIGIYLSALINASPADRITLNIDLLKIRLHFFGYKLPLGKSIVLKGDLGDFSGAALAGGELRVNGSVRNWCGTSMENGEILITGAAGQKTGEMMTGGKISVQGPILGLAGSRQSGIIEQDGRLLVPHP